MLLSMLFLQCLQFPDAGVPRVFLHVQSHNAGFPKFFQSQNCWISCGFFRMSNLKMLDLDFLRFFLRIPISKLLDFLGFSTSPISKLLDFVGFLNISNLKTAGFPWFFTHTIKKQRNVHYHHQKKVTRKTFLVSKIPSGPVVDSQTLAKPRKP